MIQDQGNVGIETTSPLAHLHVDGDATEPMGMLVYQDADDTVGLSIRRDAGSRGTNWATLQFCNNDNPGIACSYVFQDKALGGVSFGSGTGGAQTNEMHIAPGGNVGIGTTTPRLKLDIQDANRAALVLSSTNNTAGNSIADINFLSDTTNTWWHNSFRSTSEGEVLIWHVRKNGLNSEQSIRKPSW